MINKDRVVFGFVTVEVNFLTIQFYFYQIVLMFVRKLVSLVCGDRFYVWGISPKLPFF
jgi:hypothetical protein